MGTNFIWAGWYYNWIGLSVAVFGCKEELKWNAHAANKSLTLITMVNARVVMSPVFGVKVLMSDTFGVPTE